MNVATPAAAATTARPGGYWPALDGLRAIAVLWVLLFHAGVPPFRGGFIGVDVFFVLSGCLITGLLLAEFDAAGRIALGHFYVRRALRLVPALALVLALFVLASWVRLDAAGGRASVREALWAGAYLTNWVRAFGLDPMPHLGHTWSLAIEEQFYLLWPALLLACVRGGGGGARRVLALALALALAVWGWRVALTLAGASADRLYNGLDTRVDTLMWGCALAAAVQWRRGAPLPAPLARGLAWVALGALALLALAACTLDWQARGLYLGGSVMVAALSALLVFDLACNPASRLRRALSWPPLVALGRVSYGVYLWHFVIYVFLYRQGVPRLEVQLLGSALTALAVWASWRWVEQPALRLKRYVRAAAPAPGAGAAC